MRLRYTPEAISDLQGIRKYIKVTLRNSQAAARIPKMILDHCAGLKEFPESGVSLAALTGYETDLRMLVCGHFLALYRIDRDAVSVARIINARQDYMRTLLYDADIGSSDDQ